MPRDRILNYYTTARQRAQAAEGKGIHGLVAQAIQVAGWDLRLHDKFDLPQGPGYHLIDNLPVTSPHTLVLRRCHMEPFYRIEATNDRWDWEVAERQFSPQPGSEWFLRNWQERLFKNLPITSDGYIFMPLQGKLLGQKAHQAFSPIDMIKATLRADPKRRVLATLHPKETYGDEEISALQQFDDRFQLMAQPSMPLLAGCDYVVTENSAMAFTGYFARKPAVLFAEMDFHHIAGSVPRQGVEQAFQTALKPQPFASYLKWFLRDHAISAWSEDSVEKIIARFRSHGWPI